MTHFVGAVAVEGEDMLEDALARFDEGLKVPRYLEATKEEVIRLGRKRIHEYATEGPYAKYKADPDGYAADFPGTQHLKYLQEEFPKKLGWTDEQVYADATTTYSRDKGPEGQVYSTYNPLSRWDWWTVGGRWTDVYDGLQGVLVPEYLHLGLPDLPRAVVVFFDGDWQWVGRGDEGWFGVITDEYGDAKWEVKASEALKKAPHDFRLYFVDFHI